MEIKKQYGIIDIAKYISALLVVAIHTYPFAEVSAAFNGVFVALICRLAVPFFFVTSAFFFFGRVERENMDAQNRLYRYLLRLCQLYLVWTVIYIPYTIWNYLIAGVTWFSPLGWLRDFFLNGSYYHLWFLPALILGTILIYRLWLLHGLKTAALSAFVLYLLGYLVNVLGPLWLKIPGADTVYTGFVQIFGTARNGLFFAPVFIVIGLYASKVRVIRKRFATLGFLISFAGLTAEVLLYQALGLLQELTCMFLFLVPVEFFLIQLLIRVKLPWKKEYLVLRKESTLIYVSHILFARILLAMLPEAHLVAYFLTLCCSQLFAWLVLQFQPYFGWLKYLS